MGFALLSLQLCCGVWCVVLCVVCGVWCGVVGGVWCGRCVRGVREMRIERRKKEGCKRE